MLHDNIYHLRRFEGEKILFDSPHNRKVPEDVHLCITCIIGTKCCPSSVLRACSPPDRIQWSEPDPCFLAGELLGCLRMNFAKSSLCDCGNRHIFNLIQLNYCC